MDTISRENNSMLPIGGIIVGLVGVILGGLALAQASKANKAVADHQPKIEKIDGLEAAASGAAASAERAAKEVRELRNSTQEAFNAVGGKLGEFQTSITKLEDSMKKPVVADKAGKKSGPAVAGPGEYIVKAGDGGPGSPGGESRRELEQALRRPEAEGSLEEVSSARATRLSPPELRPGGVFFNEPAGSQCFRPRLLGAAGGAAAALDPCAGGARRGVPSSGARHDPGVRRPAGARLGERRRGDA
jgi:hypothetical protein